MLIIKRTSAVQATIDRFFDKPFSWGSEDCAHLVAYHLRALGYADPLANIQTYATRRNALKAMRKAGIANLASHLEDGLGFEAIPLATALPGDIVGLPAEEADADSGWLTLGVHVGQDRVLCFSEGKGALGAASVATHAWRTNPRDLGAV